jgi:hypothetical protein
MNFNSCINDFSCNFFYIHRIFSSLGFTHNLTFYRKDHRTSKVKLILYLFFEIFVFFVVNVFDMAITQLHVRNI